MTTSQLNKALQCLRKTALHDGADMSDGQLLDHFIQQRDETAFSALVRRHGPMVWGVCCRTVGHHHDAEDAFQATFLVLARKAAAIQQRDLLANWLYGVAHRTALKAKATTGKRRGRERQMRNIPEPGTQQRDTWRDLEPHVDQELAGLPDKYRIAILLCDLEGKTGKEVARQLKIPEGTLSSRLRTARLMLAKRLARQGLALSGGALATMLSRNAASACAPTAVVSSTVKAAPLFAAGQAAASSIVSAKVAALTEGVLKAMMVTKLKTVTAVLLVLGMVVFGGGLLSHGAAVGQPLTPDRDVNKSAERKADLRKSDFETRNATSPEILTNPSATKQAGLQTEKTLGKVAYAVADLVVPIRGLDIPLRSSKKAEGRTKEAWLISKITRTVAPASWQVSGGTGTIQYSPRDMSLIVNNTPSIQAQVKYMLETMRRVQDVQIVAETRILSFNAACFLKVQGLLPHLTKDCQVVLNELETSALLGKTQDEAGTKVIRAPKITFFPGQRVNLAVDPIKGVSGINKIEVELDALVAGNLEHVNLEVQADLGTMEFKKAARLRDGDTLAQVKCNGDDYLVFLVTPRVILAAEIEEMMSTTGK